MGGMQGQASDIAIQAEQISHLKKLLAEKIAYHTGQTPERIREDSERDRWFTAQEAKEYGFIDEVITRSKTRKVLASESEASTGGEEPPAKE